MRTIKKSSFVLMISLILTASCSYHYFQGEKLEEQGRFEEANIEYHRAYVDEPENKDYKIAFKRTAAIVAKDFLKRYNNYLRDKKMSAAFDMLERAQQLSPDSPTIKEEKKQ